MALVRIALTEATDEQIRDFCEIQQLETDAAKSRGDLMALLGPVWEHDYIPIQQATPIFDAEAGDRIDLSPIQAEISAQQTLKAAPVAGQIVGGVGHSDPRVKLKITKTEMPGGKDPVPIGVNGRTVVVQRDVVVDLPYRYFEALENAVRQEVEQNEIEGDLIITDILNYPLQVLERPSAAAVDAWHAATDGHLLPA